MDQPRLNWIAGFIWNIADDVLRDLYVRGKYRDVILPMTVLRRLDAVLEPTKQAVLDMKGNLDREGVLNQDAALRLAAEQAFYNTSKFTLRDLKARASQQQLRADFEAYLDGFSPNVQDILEKFDLRHQIPTPSRADVLGTLIEKFLSPDINLSPKPGAQWRRLGEAPRTRQPCHGHDLRGAGPALQRGEQRGSWRALDPARRGAAHGEPRLPADRRRDRIGHLPQASASPQVVLDTYLHALAAGDCSTGRQLWAEGAATSIRGDLCGETQVSAYGITGPPAQPNADELVFSTTLTTTGTRDGSVRAGPITWFFTLRRQANGDWRIDGGGSGP